MKGRFAKQRSHTCASYRVTGKWQWNVLVAKSESLRGAHSRSAGNTLEVMVSEEARDYLLGREKAVSTIS